MLRKAEILRDPANHWLSNGCDAMISAGEYACGGGDPNVLAAEYENEPGRFNRKPEPFCGPDHGSKTTWSRDMGVAGLLPYAWCSKDLPTLQRHISYGEHHHWLMGSPIDDGRVFYSPQLIGLLYRENHGLGGKYKQQEEIPYLYPKNLDGYEAHLQMAAIWLDLEIKGKIPKKALDRIKEHSSRMENCPFYQYLAGRFDGSMDKPMHLLLNPEQISCDYGADDEGSGLARWLFSAKLVLDSLDAL